MIVQLAKKSATLHATGNLIRENIKTEFKYATIGARKYTVNDSQIGYMRVQASTSIKTHDELFFVLGDKILLEGYEKPLRIANLNKYVNEKQLMFLSTPTKIMYTIDLG